MICPNCQTQNPDDGKFCKKCGTLLTAIVCPCCKKENADDATFCTYCGTPLDVAEKQESAPAKPTQTEAKEEKGKEEKPKEETKKDEKPKGGILLLISQILVGLAIAAMVFTLICRFAYQTIITETPSEYSGFYVRVDVYPFVGDKIIITFMDHRTIHNSTMKTILHQLW